MKHSTWSDPIVIRTVGVGFVSLKIDGAKNAQLGNRLHIDGFSVVVLLSPVGTVPERVEGYVPPKNVLKRLEKATKATAAK